MFRPTALLLSMLPGGGGSWLVSIYAGKGNQPMSLQVKKWDHHNLTKLVWACPACSVMVDNMMLFFGVSALPRTAEGVTSHQGRCISKDHQLVAFRQATGLVFLSKAMLPRRGDRVTTKGRGSTWGFPCSSRSNGGMHMTHQRVLL